MRQALGVLFGLVAPALAGLAGLAGILNLQDTDVIPGKYIISLIPGADSAQHLSWVRDVHRRSLERRGNIGSTAGLEKTYGFGDFSAYAGEFDVETILQILSSENVGSL